MKTLLIIPLFALSIQLANAQSRVHFANNNVTRVFNGTTGEPLPLGSQFLAALYYADDGIVDDSVYVQIGDSTTIHPQPGVFYGGTRTAPTPVPGGWGMFQVRVWESAFGATYEDAVAAEPQGGSRALAGKSNIVRVLTSFPDSMKISAPLTRLQGFEVHPVPEPLAVLLIGLSLTLLIVRKGHFWK